MASKKRGRDAHDPAIDEALTDLSAVLERGAESKLRVRRGRRAEPSFASVVWSPATEPCAPCSDPGMPWKHAAGCLACHLCAARCRSPPLADPSPLSCRSLSSGRPWTE